MEPRFFQLFECLVGPLSSRFDDSSDNWNQNRIDDCMFGIVVRQIAGDGFRLILGGLDALRRQSTCPEEGPIDGVYRQCLI
jgi:hypothetical protein